MDLSPCNSDASSSVRGIRFSSPFLPTSPTAQTPNSKDESDSSSPWTTAVGFSDAEASSSSSSPAIPELNSKNSLLKYNVEITYGC